MYQVLQIKLLSCLFYRRKLFFPRLKYEIMPQGVDCENSHLFSLRTAMGVARLHAVCQIEMRNVKQDALHVSNLART